MSSDTVDGGQIMKNFVPASPLVRLLGIRLIALGSGEATLELPFRDEIATIGQTIHGGAIAALADTALMAACWSGYPPPESLRGSTVDLTVHYLAPANGTNLTATARVLRRGRRLNHGQVSIVDSAGAPVAHALGTYQLG